MLNNIAMAMMDLKPIESENKIVEASPAATSKMILSEMPSDSDNNICADRIITSTTMEDEESESQKPDAETTQSTSNAILPKTPIGNAWETPTKTADSTPQPIDAKTNNAKKRSNVTFLSGDAPVGTDSINSDTKGNISSKPKFADIMAEQELEKNVAKPSVISRTKVSFCHQVESEEERMMRLAIEASLKDQQNTTQGFQSHAAKMPASALRNSRGSDTGNASSPHNVSFSNNNVAYDESDGMDDDMRMAIALSLQEAEGGGDNKSCYASSAIAGSYDADSANSKDYKMEEEEDDRKPSALPKKEMSPRFMEDESKPAAIENQSAPEFHPAAAAATCTYSSSSTASATAYTTAAAASTTSAAAAAATASGPPNDEPEKLAQALYQTELAEYGASQSINAAAQAAYPPSWNQIQEKAELESFQEEEDANRGVSQSANDAAEAASLQFALKLQEEEDANRGASQSANDAAEAASLQFALKLQEEEDARYNIEREAEAARLKRAEMCHGGGGGSVGVRTVGKDEFNSLKSDKDYGDDGMIDRRRQEERGMGKLLSSKLGYGDEGMTGDDMGANYDNETDDYYYYANDRRKGDTTQQDYELGEEDQDAGIRMNSQSSSSSWKRLDRDTFIGPDGEIRTKHDPELSHRSNAVSLIGSSDNEKSASVSDRAYNAFRRAESRQSGFKKGVAKQGHGRAENMNAGKTRGGALDGNARLQISAAINAGLIENFNGVVKEGKEALVYHADGGWKGRQASAEGVPLALSPDGTTETLGSDGYDVAVKVFKRIAEFKGRGGYVDGDPRYHKQKFKTNDQREQVVLWAEKEYRNLIRAHRAGIAVPKPLHQKDNILFMRFLGDGGWPSPQLKEIDIKKGSGKWTTFYCQTLVSIRRLYHCARLIHADLSEYNLLICPSWQASQGQLIASDKRTPDDETLQVVLIDFGQAVEVGHPSASAWLRRDLCTVRDFFVKQGIKTLSNEEAEDFVTNPSEEANEAVDVTGATDEGTSDMNEVKEDSSIALTTYDNNWRYAKGCWDDTKDMEVLLNKLKG